MITLNQIDIATLDETSVEDFEILMNEYTSSQSETYKTDSKKLFLKIVASLQQDPRTKID